MVEEFANLDRLMEPIKEKQHVQRREMNRGRVSLLSRILADLIRFSVQFVQANKRAKCQS